VCAIQKVNVLRKYTSQGVQTMEHACKQCTALFITRPQFTLGDVRSHSQTFTLCKYATRRVDDGIIKQDSQSTHRVHPFCL
jgi:hypothetical protein